MANENSVKFGSPEHAALLGLRKAAETDSLKLEGWTLVDMTAFGPQATETFLMETLRQKVSVYKSGGPKLPQSTDPLKPNYAPPLWKPGESRSG